MFEKAAGRDFDSYVVPHKYLDGSINAVRKIWLSSLWSVRFAKVCAEELRINDTRGQFHRLVDEDCLQRIFQRTDGSG